MACFGFWLQEPCTPMKTKTMPDEAMKALRQATAVSMHEFAAGRPNCATISIIFHSSVDRRAGALVLVGALAA
jgi:hypothetical protein